MAFVRPGDRAGRECRGPPPMLREQRCGVDLVIVIQEEQIVALDRLRARLQAHRLSVAGKSLGDSPLLGEEIAVIAPQLGRVRNQTDRFAKARLGLLELTATPDKATSPAQRLLESRVNRKRPAVAHHRLIVFADLREDDPQVGEGHGEARLET